jgi:Raf kinase inhibitor-like YbhB/YbcL family protein
MQKAAAKPVDPDREARRTTSPGGSTSGTAPVAVPLFVLRSPTLREGQTIANMHIYDGAGGENVSPALEWSHAPAGTKSLAVTLHDPDPSSVRGWWHWVMYNIPPNVTRLAAGVGDPAREFTPGITHGNTDFGRPGYGGPCPPKGDPPHRYIFSIHALDVDRIEAGENASAASIAAHIRAHWLASAALTGKYAR